MEHRSKYSFTRSLASKVRDHNDRQDFLARIDLILNGIGKSDYPEDSATEAG